jgi:hypothetical protein
MSIASGRAWMAAGQGLNNIGAMLLQGQERDRELQRQAEADKIAARNQQMRELAFTQETGLTVGGTPAPQTGVYSGGEYVPVMGKQLAPMAAAAPASAAPVAPKVTPPNPLSAIGAMATGGQIPTPRSAAQRADDERLKRASVGAGALAANGSTGTPLNPAFAALSWREQLNTVQNPTAMSAIDQRQRQDETRASATAEATRDHTSAEGYRRRFGPDNPFGLHLTPGLSDEQVIRDASGLMAREEAAALRQRSGAGGAGATNRALLAVEKQVDDSRTDLAREEARQYRGRGVVLRDSENRPLKGPALEAALPTFVRDSTAAAGRLQGLRARTDSLGGVRDQLAGQLPGMPQAPAAPKPGAGATQAQARARALELLGGRARTPQIDAQIRATMTGEGYRVQ